MSNPLCIQLPNGGFMYTSCQVQILLKIGNWRCVYTPWVLKTAEYDVILGQDWLKQFNPDIDWVTGRIVMKGHGMNYTIIYPINLRN
jgi:hypothetical protein